MTASRTVQARVVEEAPNGLFQLELENLDRVLAHPGSQTSRDFVRLLPGDRVEVVLGEKDLKRGRVTRKL